MTRILGIHPGALGDVILFGRLCQTLGGEVTLLAHQAVGRLLEGLGVVHRAIDFESLPMHEVFHDKPLTDCLLPSRLGQCERLISCFAAGERPAELRLAMLVGADSAAFLPVRPPADYGSHLVELWCDLLGIEQGRDQAAWTVPAAWRREAEASLAGCGVSGQYAVIHPGSGGKAKCWPAARFVELARRLQEGGLAPVFVLGPAELERWSARDIGSIRREFALMEHPSLERLAGMLTGCRVYVGNDSGVSHLAGAAGARSIVLFGPSNPRHFAPLGPKVTILHRPSLTDLSVDEVARTVMAFAKS